MNILDLIIIIGLIIGGYIGYKRGLLLSLLSFISFSVILIVSFLLTTPLTNLLMKTAVLDIASERSLDLLSSFGGIMISEIPTYDSLVFSLAESMPAFLAKALAKPIWSMIGSYTDMTLAEVLTPLFTKFLISVISFILLLITLSIIVGILRQLAKFINDIPLIGNIDSLIGCIFGITIALLYIFVALYIASYFTSFEWFAKINDIINNSLFGSFMYNHNLIGIILSGVFNKLFHLNS